MGVVVVVGEQQPERVVADEPPVERELGVEVERALQMQHPPAVPERGVHAQRREVVDRVVDPAQPGDHERLDPQAGAPRLHLGSLTSAQGATGSSPRAASVSSTRGSAATVRRHELGAE